MIYVGWIVEKVSGMDLASAVKKLVLDPLGMTHSCWGPLGVSRQSISHTGWSGQTIVADPGTGFYGVVLTARKSMEHGKCRQAREKLMSITAAGAATDSVVPISALRGS